MIELKNDNDILLIKKAREIGMNTLTYSKSIIHESMTTNELDNKIEKYILKNNAIPAIKGYEGFTKASCISIENEIIHGLPRERIIQLGDVVKIDIVVEYKKRYSDQAITLVVGNNTTDEIKRLIYATKLALDRAKLVAKDGNYTNDIAYEIQRTAKEYNLGILKDFAGHGVGFKIHEEISILNEVNSKYNKRLIKGMVIAIEPMFTLGSGDYIRKPNGVETKDGSIGAHFEETVIIC